MIQTIEQLRGLYAPAKERAVKKQLSALDVHCQRFIELSPFVVLSSIGLDQMLDASPRGGAPGFVKSVDAHTLLIPDSPGNNRLDTLQNIIHSGKVGLLFLIPGMDETLRVNGTACLSDDAAVLALCTTEVRTPKLVIKVTVAQAYLHCAKAFMRSGLWKPEQWPSHDELPRPAQVWSDHIALSELDEAAVEAFVSDDYEHNL